MTTLPNGKPIDLDMLEMAMEDSDLANRYFLNLVTGEVVFFSDYLGLSNEDEWLLEEIDGSDDYVAIERIPSHEAYQWMVDFVEEVFAPVGEQAAEKLFIALGHFVALMIRCIVWMSGGCKGGISGGRRELERLLTSGLRIFFS